MQLNRCSLILILFLILIPLQITMVTATDKITSPASIDAAAIIKTVETQYQGRSSHGTVSMTIKTRRWTRTIVMESWSEGRDKFLTRIISPAKEKGTCTLKVANDIWNYLPNIDRLIKIPASLMGESWMGSHLTNDDLVKDNKIDELYQLEVTGQNDVSIEITGVPLPDAAVVWGKIVYRVDTEKMIPLTVDFFDEEGAKVRTMTFSDVKNLGDRWLPMLFRVVPTDKPEEYTEMHYQNLNFSFEPPRDFFSLKTLRNR